jgi:elongation factor G
VTGATAVPTSRIRNVILLGHGGTGKTTLAEQLLRAAGAGGGRGGVLDSEPEEKERSHTLGLNVATFTWQDHKINLLDAPGMPDAIGDAYPALRLADMAVFVVDASLGIQPQHDELWAACAELGLPRMVFLNKLDRENATYQSNIDALRERYGKPLAPIEMPMGVEQHFTGVIDLLHMTAVRDEGDHEEDTTIPEDRREQAERNREHLVEAIVENDDELLMRYLDGDVPEAKELGECFAHGIAQGGFFPVLCGAAQHGLGVHMLADFIVEECPSPTERGAVAASDGSVRELEGPTAIWVGKTLSDPYVGHINIMRVLTGTLRQDDVLTVGRSGGSVRLHQLFTLRGREQTPVSAVGPGDIVAVAKLEDVHTSDVLHAKDAPFALDPVPLPQPHHRVALEPASAGDEDKLSSALAKVAEEDPSLVIDRNAETNQLVVHAYGQIHVEVALARMERKFGVAVRQVPLRLAYRETLRGPAAGLGRHVKQSGGHGQYGIAHIEAEPLPRGEGFEFEDKIVGGVIPNTYIPSVEKGIVDAMAQGVLTGYPVVDVQVRLVDGKHHSVDSSDMAFQVAGSLAFRDAAEKAGIVLLEPIMDVEVLVPDDLTGAVMGDVSSRRGRIQGTEQAAPGRTSVRALVPEAEVLNYTAELRSLTSGQGTLHMRYDHHDEMPEHVAKKVIAEAAEAKAG